MKAPLFLSAVLGLVPVPALAQEVLDSCGQDLEGAFVLEADLDCSGHDGFAVRFRNRSSLDLAGHTLTARAGVYCLGGDCRVWTSVPGGTLQGVAPGASTQSGVYSHGARWTIEGITITGFLGAGASAVYDAGGLVSQTTILGNGGGISAWRKLVVRDSVISGNNSYGIVAPRKAACERSDVDANGAEGIRGASSGEGVRLSLKECNVTGNAGSGVIGFRKVFVRDSRIAGNGGCGVAPGKSGRVLVGDSTIEDNGNDGVGNCGGWEPARGVKLSGSAVTGNAGAGVADVQSVRARESDISSNALDGIDLEVPGTGRPSVRLSTGTTVAGNGRFGVVVGEFNGAAGRVKLSQSTATGNGADASCASLPCADLATLLEPGLDPASGCGTSYQLGSGFPGQDWGVCTLD